MYIRVRTPPVAVCLVYKWRETLLVSRAARPHVFSLVQACREDRRIFRCILVNRTYIYSIINGHIKAYINGIIGLFLVLQPSHSTTPVQALACGGGDGGGDGGGATKNIISPKFSNFGDIIIGYN